MNSKQLPLGKKLIAGHERRPPALLKRNEPQHRELKDYVSMKAA